MTKARVPRNSFEYEVTAGVERLLRIIDDRVENGSDWAMSAAIEAWRTNEYWDWLRDGVEVRDPGSAVARAYSLLQRPIGPASLRSVAFLAGMFCSTISCEDLVSRVIGLTSNLPGASISGGRYSSSPEGIYLSKESLELMRTNEE